MAIFSFCALSLFAFEAMAAKPAAKPAGKSAAKPASSAKGSLIIESTSTGATVFIDGKEYGTIPFKPTSLTAGKHKIEVKNMGFLDYSNEVQINAGKGTRLKVDLLPVASIVNLASMPAKATVYIDGKERGTTPTKVELKTGTYNIEFKLKGYLPFKKQLKITKLGEKIPISATLEQDKLATDKDEDPLLALPLDLPLEIPGEDPLALEPVATPPGGAEDDPLSLEPLDLEPVDNGAKAISPTAPPPPSPEAPSAQGDASSDNAALLVVPAGAVGGGMTATTKVEKEKTKWYKTWWFWTITGAVIVGAAVGIGVGVSQAHNTDLPHYEGTWVLGQDGGFSFGK